MEDHFQCKQQACIEQKFVVFATEMDLRGHMVEAHGTEMSSRDRRDMRRLETDFEYEDHRRRGGVGSRERDRDFPPQRQPPNMRRRELGTGLTTDTPVSGSSTPVPSVNLPAPPPDADILTAESVDVTIHWGYTYEITGGTTPCTRRLPRPRRIPHGPWAPSNFR